MLLKRDTKSYLPKVTIRKWQRQDSNLGVGLRTRASNCPATPEENFLQNTPEERHHFFLFPKRI